MLVSIMFFSCYGGTRERPICVPAHAEWIGGSDGGAWISFENESEQGELEFSIYHESGKLWVSALFAGYCVFDKSSSLADQIRGFDGESLLMKEKLPNGKYCILRAINKD